MSLDSNAQPNFEGSPLTHFTPFPTPHSAGDKLFAQNPITWRRRENPYVFPLSISWDELLSFFFIQEFPSLLLCLICLLNPFGGQSYFLRPQTSLYCAETEACMRFYMHRVVVIFAGPFSGETKGLLSKQLTATIC